MNATYAYTPYIWPMLASAFFMAALGVYAWKHRTVPGASPFAVQMLFSALWALCTAIEIAAIVEPTKVFWYRLGRISALPALTALLCFALDYASPGKRTVRRNVLVLSALTLLCIAVLVTNDLHHLYWSRLWFDGFVRVERGPLSPVVAGYILLLPILALLIFLRLALRSRGILRGQALLLLTGNLLPLLAFSFEWVGINPIAPLNPTILMLNLTGLLFTLAIYRFGMLGVIPVGRDMAMEHMAEGFLILDAENRIADINPAARAALTQTLHHAIGRSALEVLAAYPNLSSLVKEERMAETEISMHVGGQARYYQVSASPLVDSGGFKLGRLISLQDVTVQKRAQAQIVEQQRALAMLAEREQLARELHDDIGQVLGYVKMQAQAARDRLTDDKKTAADSELAKLIAVAQDAHSNVREYILAARSATATGFHLIPALRQYLRRFQEHYGVCVELIAPSEWADDALGPTVEVQLLRIIQEALNNVRKHAQARSVQVCLQIQDDYAQIVVQDDGTGFDPASQTNMQGQKYGLSFMRERAEEVGSSIVIHSTPGAGTQVVICIPRRNAREETGRQP